MKISSNVDVTGTITASNVIIAPTATTSIPSIRMPHGAAPTAPTNGDMWTTTLGCFVRINGTTRDLVTGSAAIVTLGTIATGTWNATTIGVNKGGTGRVTSTTAYGLIAAGTTATGAHQTLAAGLTTQILVGGGAAALPVWTTATGSGAPVRATSPTLVTPVLGVATGTSFQGIIGNVTPAAGTFTTVTSTGNITVGDASTDTLIVQAGSAALPSIIPTGDPNTGLWFPAADTVAISTAGSERFRIGSAGQLGIAGANFGTAGQLLTSGGAGAAPSWVDSSSIGGLTVSNIAGNTTAVTGIIYYCAASLTLTLPASPTPGTRIHFVVYPGTVVYLGRNALNIMGLAEDLYIDKLQGTYLSVVYLDATSGWII